ncbi:MAG: hypothetical protein IKU98_01475 [Bacteroidaceae bacterium]|nr:hypothetical protein [Bacteroidaceae bacterium]
MDYEPIAIAYEQDENGFGVQIEDNTGNYPTVWIDVYDFKDDDYPSTDWNMYIFHKDCEYDMKVKKMQDDSIKDDGWMWCLIEECAINYLYANGKIEPVGNGYRMI